MPSRKRNKGRTRKAKGSSGGGVPSNDDGGGGPKLDDGDDLTDMLSSMNMNDEKTCNHGCCEPVPSCCRKLLEALYELKLEEREYSSDEEGFDFNRFLCSSVKAFIASCPEAVSDDSVGETVKRFLLSKGAGEILNRKQPAEIMYRIATIVLMIELNLHGDSKNTNIMKILDQMMKLFNGSLRELYRFYSKRLPSSCMKEPYAVIRSQEPKTSFCDHCKQRKERSALRVCSVCRMFHYCSRECQVAAWPEHKKNCATDAANLAKCLCRND